MPKKYADAANYEAKLKRVMQRFGVTEYKFDWGRFLCWVEFVYKGKLRRFENGVKRAQEHGVKIDCGSDAFAILVLTLESLARAMEYGVFDFGELLDGIGRCLPAPTKIPDCFVSLGFAAIPTPDELHTRRKQVAKAAHPDAGGSNDYFIAMKIAYEAAIKELEERENG